MSLNEQEGNLLEDLVRGKKMMLSVNKPNPLEKLVHI